MPPNLYSILHRMMWCRFVDTALYYHSRVTSDDKDPSRSMRRVFHNCNSLALYQLYPVRCFAKPWSGSVGALCCSPQGVDLQQLGSPNIGKGQQNTCISSKHQGTMRGFSEEWYVCCFWFHYCYYWNIARTFMVPAPGEQRISWAAVGPWLRFTVYLCCRVGRRCWHGMLVWRCSQLSHLISAMCVCAYPTHLVGHTFGMMHVMYACK